MTDDPRRAGDLPEAMVPMRDGLRLHPRVWLPEGDGPFPTVLTRADPHTLPALRSQ